MLSKAKTEAETKGYIFETNHDAIVAKAKKEGKLVVFSSQDAEPIRAAADAFRKKYPFIDVKATEIGGTDNYTRMVQELKLGKTTAWDVNYVAFDYYADYLPHQKKFDLLGMGKHGVLRIPPEMVDPVNRHIGQVRQQNAKIRMMVRARTLHSGRMSAGANFDHEKWARSRSSFHASSTLGA